MLKRYFARNGELPKSTSKYDMYVLDRASRKIVANVWQVTVFVTHTIWKIGAFENLILANQQANHSLRHIYLQK